MTRERHFSATRTRSACPVLVALALLGAPGVAHAQPRRPGARTVPSTATPRVTVVIDVGAQAAQAHASQSFTVSINADDAPLEADLKPDAAGFFDGGARVRVGRRLQLGGIGFITSGHASGTASGSIPHPFYFGQPREVSGTVSGLTRTERGAHVELAYPVPAGRSTEVLLFGGPSFFRLEQEVVIGIEYSESYPFDKATFTRATTSTAHASGAGFNVGGEASWRLSQTTRLAALVRYARARVTLDAAAGNTVEVTAGGVQAGVGLRFLF